MQANSTSMVVIEKKKSWMWDFSKAGASKPIGRIAWQTQGTALRAARHMMGTYNPIGSKANWWDGVALQIHFPCDIHTCKKCTPLCSCSFHVLFIPMCQSGPVHFCSEAFRNARLLLPVSNGRWCEYKGEDGGGVRLSNRSKKKIVNERNIHAKRRDREGEMKGKKREICDAGTLTLQSLKGGDVESTETRGNMMAR